MAISPKKRALALVVVLIVAGAVAYYFLSGNHAPEKTVTIYGNIDIRQVQSAFDDNGRLLDLRVQEGDRVKKGQLLADLDPVRFQDAVDKDAAGMAAQEQVLARLLAGSRPEEIAEARAEAAAAQATLSNAEITWQRQQALAARQYVPKQSLDNAAAALKTARANLDRAQQALTLAIVVGPAVALLLTVMLLWGRALDLTDVLLGLVLYLVSGFGITVGYHRLFTHRTFKAAPAVLITLAILGVEVVHKGR